MRPPPATLEIPMPAFDSLLNNTFVVERRVRTPDGQGGWTISYAEIGAVAGRIRPAGSAEREVAAAEERQISHVLYTRASADVARGDRVSCGNLVVEVQACEVEPGRRAPGDRLPGDPGELREVGRDEQTHRRVAAAEVLAEVSGRVADNLYRACEFAAEEARPGRRAGRASSPRTLTSPWRTARDQEITGWVGVRKGKGRLLGLLQEVGTSRHRPTRSCSQPCLATRGASWRS